MSILYISLILKENEIVILGGVIHLLILPKRKILFGICITPIESCYSTITVPINISFSSFHIDVFAAFQIKPTITMLRILSAFFTKTTIVSCQSQRLFPHFFLSVAKEIEAALLQSCFLYPLSDGHSIFLSSQNWLHYTLKNQNSKIISMVENSRKMTHFSA